MKFEQASYSIENVIQLKESVNAYFKQQIHAESSRDTNDRTSGGVLSDTRYSWLSCGPRLQVLHTKSGAKVAAWRFRSQHDFETVVTCICDLPSTRGKAPLVVVGLECEITGGMICIFDIGSSRVLRAIQIEDKVTSIEVVSGGGEDGLPGVLRALDGVVAVGTAKGKVLLIDICRQICEEAISNTSNESIRDEINSCHLMHISLEDLRKLESHKQISLNKGEHLCLQLNEDSTSGVHFSLFGPNGDLRLRANMSEVIVSSLHFSKVLGSILVGFNMGAWQMYHLVATAYPVLAYTSPMYENCVPVAHFAEQEPCDDPKAFYYVWVVYSVQETDIIRNTEKDTAMAVMYSLTYDSKEYLEDYGVIYQELLACSVRFQIELANIVPETGNIIARCISLRSYTRQLSNEAPEERLALCSIAWTCWDPANTSSLSNTYLALFDLNQWYKEQMPAQPRAQTERFMVCVNVTELLASHGDVASEELLDLHLDSSSLSPFSCSLRLEEHFYPSALAFKALVVSPDRLIWLRSAGSQRHLLGQLELAGPLCLLHPSELFHRCLALGLSPAHCDVPANPSAQQQRELVLNVALEHQLVHWLCCCARDWASGAQSSAGCTLDFLLDWAWRRANTLKSTCDKVCVPLFDYTGQRLDHNALWQLNHGACQLKHLSTVFCTVLMHCYMYFTQQDIEDIRYQHNSLTMITTYLEVLQWLLNVGLLPECPLSMYPLPDHEERLSAPYPADSLARYYNSRRAEQQDEPLLFIDQLVARDCGGQRLHQLWRGDGGSGLYPPPSLQALLHTYLLEDIDMEYKHCLVMYVFLDLAMTLDQSMYKSIITHLIKFPAVFKLSPSIIKITQAFWQLDHADFNTAMAQLLDPAVASNDLKPWHHRTVLKALLMQGQHQHALLYHEVRKPPVSSVEDICVIITLLIVNDLLQEAFHFQKQNRSVSNEKEILKHFFSVSDKVKKLSNVLQLPLSSIEEASFISYLRSHSCEANENLLVIYFLQRDRYDEAFRANEALNAEFNKKHVKQGILGQQERNFRNVIVEGFKKTLPNVTQVLLDIVEKEKSFLKTAAWQNLARPLPMSIYVHDTQEQAKYKSTLIQASFRKARETWTHQLHEDDNDTPFISTPKVQPVKNISNETRLIYATTMQLPASSSADLATPAKRIRLSSRSPIRRQQRLSSGHSPSLSLLDTPIVKRKSYRESPASSVVGTPASILKVRSFIRQSISPGSGDDRGTSTTPENLEDLQDMEVDSGVTSKRSSIIRPRSSLGVSPRRPITRTPRSAVHFEDVGRPSSRSSDGSSAGQHLDLTESKDSSRSVDDVFYSPDASVSDNTDNIVNEQVTQVDEETRRSLKRKSTDSVKSRRSYKITTPVERNLRSKNSPVVVITESTPRTVKSIPEPSSAPSVARKSEAFPKLGGRRSLSRQVLVQNTLAKVLPTMQTRLSLNSRENEKTVGVEVSYSKTTTSIVTKSSDTVTEEKCDRSTVEMKNIFTTETEPDKKQIIKHVHNESSSKSSVKKVTEVLDEKISLDEDNKQSFEESFTSYAADDKTDSNSGILSSSSDVDESFLNKLTYPEYTNESMYNNSIFNETTQQTIEEYNETTENIDEKMEDINEHDIQLNKPINLTDTVFEDISSIIDEEDDEEEMETSIQEKIIQNKEQIQEKSIVIIEESSKDSSETEKLSNQSSNSENTHPDLQTNEESSREASSVASSQTKNYLVPSSEEETDEEEKTSNQDEENEQGSNSESESEDSSHSSDVIEIKSSSEDSNQMDELKLKLNTSEEKQNEVDEKQDQEELEEEQDQEDIEEEQDQEQIEEEQEREEIEEQISEKHVLIEQENIVDEINQNEICEATSVAEEVIQMEEEIQNTDTIQESVQQDDSVDIPEDIQQEIEECMQEEQLQLQELSNTENKSKDSSKRDLSQDCLETMSFTVPEEQLHQTDILCHENLTDKPSDNILQIEMNTGKSTQSVQLETGTDLIENLTSEDKLETQTENPTEKGADLIKNLSPEVKAKDTYTPSRRSKRISSKSTKTEEIKPAGVTTRTRSMSVDVEEIVDDKPEPARVTRKRSTSIDIEKIEEPIPTRASTRKRSTSVDIEPPKPVRSSTRRRSTNTEVEEPTPALRITRKRSTSVDVEEVEPAAARTTRTRSTETDDKTDDGPKRSTRASSVVNLPVIAEETNRNRRASSLEPKSSQSPGRRGRKRSILAIPEEPVSTLENIPEKIEEYSATHRLTRRQKVIMEKSLEIQELKKLQPQEPKPLNKPRIVKTEDNIEMEEHPPASPSSVSTDTQSTDPGTPRRRGSRRLSTGTPTRRSTRNSKDTADDVSSVKSMPVVQLDRQDVVRYRSLSPTALQEPPQTPKGNRKSARSSILPAQTDLSKISEENSEENEPSSSQGARPKRGRPRKDKEEPSSQSSEEQETKLTKRTKPSYKPLEEYARHSVFKMRKSFKVKKLTRN